jgi:hypothetical protein
MSTVPIYTSVHRSEIDELFDGYVFWREACGAVWQTHERWIGTDRGEQWLACAASLAALDGEQLAAGKYARHTERVARLSI